MSNNLDKLIGELIQTIPYCTALLVVMVLAWFASRLLRVHLSKTELRPTDYLESFQKLHEEGELTKEEFRIIRMLLSLQISQHSEIPPKKLTADFSILNHHSPSPLAENPSGNSLKK